MGQGGPAGRREGREGRRVPAALLWRPSSRPPSSGQARVDEIYSHQRACQGRYFTQTESPGRHAVEAATAVQPRQATQPRVPCAVLSLQPWMNLAVRQPNQNRTSAGGTLDG